MTNQSLGMSEDWKRSVDKTALASARFHQDMCCRHCVVERRSTTLQVKKNPTATGKLATTAVVGAYIR